LAGAWLLEQATAALPRRPHGDGSFCRDGESKDSTPLGGHGGADALSVDSSGVVTVTGWTTSINFPTTSGAYDTTHDG